MTALATLDAPTASQPRAAARREARARELVTRHFAFVWRTLRRLGVSGRDADDAAQQVFVVATGKLERIEAGAERGFLFGIAMRVAMKQRRTLARRREIADAEPEARLDPSPGPAELYDRGWARARLDEILAEMPAELSAVFILYEIEQLTMIEIARALEVPQGTVASRLRRARAVFLEAVERLQAGDAR